MGLKTRTLTAERLRELLVYDPETGVFTRRGRNVPFGYRCPVHGYGQLRIDGVMHKAHRLAFLWMTGEWPRNVVDHVNRIRHDNRWVNLRDVTQAVNATNLSPNKHGLPRGVKQQGKRFQARLGADNRRVHLGTFDTPEAAHAAYIAACSKLHHQGETPSVNQSSSA